VDGVEESLSYSSLPKRLQRSPDPVLHTSTDAMGGSLTAALNLIGATSVSFPVVGEMGVDRVLRPSMDDECCAVADIVRNFHLDMSAAIIDDDDLGQGKRTTTRDTLTYVAQSAMRS
jgi:hypothetical protein